MFLMVEWTSRMGQGVMFDLRTRIFGNLQRADVALYDRTPVGRLMTRLTTDVDALNELFTSGFVSLLGDLAVLGGIVAILFALDPTLATITLGVLIPMALVTNWFRKGARDTYRRVRVRIARVNSFLQEHLSGIAVVQLFRREEAARGAFRTVNDDHRVANLDSIFYYAVFYPALDFLSAIGMAAILWWGGGEVIRGTMTIGAVVTFLQYSKRFYRPLMDLSEKYNILQAAMASSERIFQLLDEAPSIAAPPSPAPVPRPLRGEIEFDHVRFGYKPDEEVLKGVSFRAEPGETIALVGATGSGKSTIVSLLLRFYDVTGGSVRVDGADVRSFDPSAFRDGFGIVLQDTFLFTGTIAENVAFFDPAMPRETVERACRDVGLGPLLEAPPRRARHEADRARRRPLRRREAARLLRPGPRPRPADPDPRRGDLERRPGDRGRHREGGRPPPLGPDLRRRRAPPLDDRPGRPDPRSGTRRGPRVGDARRAPREGGPLRPPLRAAAQGPGGGGVDEGRIVSERGQSPVHDSCMTARGEVP